VWILNAHCLLCTFIFFVTGLQSHGRADICLFFKLLNTLVEEVNPYDRLFRLFDEPLTTDVKHPHVLEYGFFPFTQRRDMGQTASYI
jgi:hypothetical protein